MAQGGTRTTLALGFLTVMEHEQHGLIGGYLVLNHLGRPLEFHCTAPIKANRAQQILYGATLQPFLYGEQIGHTLVSKASTTVSAVLTDREAALATRDQGPTPVARVGRSSGGAAQSNAWCWGEYELRVGARYLNDRSAIEAVLSALAESFDLVEPFDRIREAIDEAGRGKQAA